MITKLYKHRDFINTLTYVFGENKQATLLATNTNGYNPHEMAAEFDALRRLKPKIEYANCMHIILSVAFRSNEHPEGEFIENIDNETFAKIGERFLEKRNFIQQDDSKSSLYVIARHGDRDHQHVHIIASRIRKDENVVSDWCDYYYSEIATRELEHEFGLSITPCSSEEVADAVRKMGIGASVSDNLMYSPGIAEVKNKSQNPSIRQLLADRIDVAIEDNPTVTEFIAKLKELDVYVRPRMSKHDKLQGFSFKLDNIESAGSKIGKRGYSLSKLQQRGLIYHEQNDYPAIVQAKYDIEQVELEKQQSPSISSIVENTATSIEQQLVPNIETEEQSAPDNVSPLLPLTFIDEELMLVPGSSNGDEPEFTDDNYDTHASTSEQKIIDDSESKSIPELQNIKQQAQSTPQRLLSHDDFMRLLRTDPEFKKQFDALEEKSGGFAQAIARLFDYQKASNAGHFTPSQTTIPTPTKSIGASSSFSSNQSKQYMIQLEYANTIAPVIRQYWKLQGEGRKTVKSNYYELLLDYNNLVLKRATGEEIATIPIDANKPAISNGLNKDEVQAFLKFHEELNNWEKRQQQEKANQVHFNDKQSAPQPEYQH